MNSRRVLVGRTVIFVLLVLPAPLFGQEYPAIGNSLADSTNYLTALSSDLTVWSFLRTQALDTRQHSMPASRTELTGAVVGGVVGAVIGRQLSCVFAETGCPSQPLPILAGLAIGAILGAGIASGL